MKLYSFDVDETLEISNGPIKLDSLVELRSQGHCIGICGNWGLFCQTVANWHQLVSFVNCCPMLTDMNGNVYGDKAWFLRTLATFAPGFDDRIHVGNRLGRTNSLGHVCGSNDEAAAKQAGWRFILEDDFARGER